MENITKENLKALKTRVFMDLGLRPDVMCSMLDSGESFDICLEDILVRCEKGEVLSKKIISRFIDGYSINDIREAVNKVVVGDCSSFEEAFKE